MRFSVYDNGGDELSLWNDDGTVTLTVTDGYNSIDHAYDKEAFKQLRRAVGYIWEELQRGEE